MLQQQIYAVATGAVLLTCFYIHKYKFVLYTKQQRTLHMQIENYIMRTKYFTISSLNLSSESFLENEQRTGLAAASFCLPIIKHADKSDCRKLVLAILSTLIYFNKLFPK